MEVELTIIDEHSAETRVVLRGLPAIVGRDEKADVPIRDPWASHVHCALSEVNGTLVVRDLGSKNGIFLHEHRVRESELLPGDRFTIGRTEITVHYQRITQTVVDLPSKGTAIELDSQPPSRGTSGPETRKLLFVPLKAPPSPTHRPKMTRRGHEHQRP